MKNTAQKKEVTFENMPQAVAQVVDEVSLIRSELAELKQNFQPKAPTEYLTRNEVAEWLKCDISTIHNWTVKGTLVKYCIGNRTYYKRSEIEAVMIPIDNNHSK